MEELSCSVRGWQTGSQEIQVDYQLKLFDYIFYREKRGIDQTYDIIQSISYISAADGEVRWCIKTIYDFACASS